MRSTVPQLFQHSPVSLLTRPWKKNRDGTLFYGLTKSGNRRVPLGTKDGNKNMYKGTRSSGIGRHLKHGRYQIDWSKVRTFVTPTNFNANLKPLVSHNVAELRHTFEGYEKGPLDTRLYFDKLKDYILRGRTQSAGADVKSYVERG
ncbi:AFR618Cp [Eremothecium gossypii ATCC 10895]|uniref:AFR618Cp n=1 Tax=Eremothecium gossypii (strain ATCC 10895 / CBS 109.51 / FGSC 9923 / NRRL Y-1056) TaxID=284811 RepID=Q752F8_EREGS|nr:mitochondrial 54S ribosomal protein YmL27 [Eremothecium gossypii ATCC 10895]AAS53989.1 AFR618Cp [Eremothecium gossypii ATCC 10895]AEY98303.1 FAFR618Cp [Eremothecium gossypii FDAG1]